MIALAAVVTAVVTTAAGCRIEDRLVGALERAGEADAADLVRGAVILEHDFDPPLSDWQVYKIIAEVDPPPHLMVGFDGRRALVVSRPEGFDAMVAADRIELPDAEAALEFALARTGLAREPGGPVSVIARVHDMEFLEDEESAAEVEAVIDTYEDVVEPPGVTPVEAGGWEVTFFTVRQTRRERTPAAHSDRGAGWRHLR